MAARAASSVTVMPALPAIADVYAAISGKQLEGEGIERRGFCLMAEHEDVNHPSCDYNTKDQVFHCKTCEGRGGVLHIIIGARKAETKRQAVEWCRQQKLMPDRAQVNAWDTVDVIYQYTDEHGAVMYEVGRWNNPKQFGQRAADGKGGWKTGKGALKDVTRYPYKLVSLIAAAQRGETIYVVEGEKDVERLYSMGHVATTTAQGADANWPIEWGRYFEGASRIIVIADNDDAGLKAAEKRAATLARTVPNTYLIRCLPGSPPHGDVSDWLNSGKSNTDFLNLPEELFEKAEPYVAAYPVEAVADLVEDMTDTGMGHWFAHCVGTENVRCVLNADNMWLGYDGRVWNNRVNMIRHTEIASKKMRLAAKDYNGSQNEAFQEFAEKSASMSARRNMQEASISELGAYLEQFDTKPNLLNVLNGTLNVHTGELMKHDREDYLTHLTEISYDPEAKCPNFETWLLRCVNGSIEMFDYMISVMGSCLEGNAGLRRFYYIVGPKGTGKSTFIRTLEKVLGPYAAAMDFKTITESKAANDGSGPSPALARLKGKRMVTLSEGRENDKLDVARIKQLIGGDAITARHLHSEFFEFKFEATPIATGNVMPKIVGDSSIWDKIKPIPFLHQIEMEDPEFEARELDPELPGILTLMLHGLTKLRNNRYQIVDPPEVVRARESEKDEQDPIKLFIEECIARAPGQRVEANDLRTAYKDWAVRSGMFAMGQRSLSTMLKQNHKMETIESSGKTYWNNIKLIRTQSGAF